MTAFADPNSSNLIDVQKETDKIEAQTGSNFTSTKHYQIDDDYLPKAYPKRHVALFGEITDLSVGKKVTVQLKVNGTLKSEKEYAANAFIGSSGVEPPKANVVAGDVVTFEVITDNVANIEIKDDRLLTFSGSVSADVCS